MLATNDPEDAKEKEEKYRAWIAQKTVRDKTYDLMEQLDPAIRAGNKEQARMDGVKNIIEVAISVAAAARFVGEVDKKRSSQAAPGGGGEVKRSGSAGDPPQKTLKGEFMKWIIASQHTFCNVMMMPKDLSDFSAAMDNKLRCPTCEHIYGDEGTGCKHPGGNVFIPSLQYFFPDEKKPGERQAKPLTNDQKRINIIFARESQTLWENAQEQLRQRLLDSTGDQQSKLLTDLSIKRLREWVEEDEDRKAAKEKKEAQDKRTLASKMHKQYVEQKESYLVRLPDADEMPKPPEPSMSNHKAGPESQMPLRPSIDAAAKCTVDMMGQSGQKYVYAADQHDLRKCRLRLLELGIVLKENFDEDPDSEFNMDRYKNELVNNPVLLERRYLATKAKEDNAAAFDDWMQLKSVRENSLKYLSLLKPPVLTVSTKDLGGSSTGTLLQNGSVAMGDNQPTRGSRQPSVTSSSRIPLVERDPGVKLVIDVGQALKKADRALFPDFVRWCEGIQGPPPVPGDKDWSPIYSSTTPPFVPSLFTFNVLIMLWDALEPVGCDVHSNGNSLVRDAFMKIMRPGLDYRQTFTAFADKRLPRDMDPEERKRRQDQIGLTKDQLGQLLRDMGVAMKPTEMRTLVDAFDADGDGTVTLQEFLDFTGPKREKKGGAMAALGQRCCWKTTCRVTGMPNAFAYSELTAKAARDVERGDGPGTAAGSIISASGVRREQRSKMKADASVSESKDNAPGEIENNNMNLRGSMEGISHATGNTTGGMEIVTMKNGEKRMCMEHKERSKRYDILVALMGRTISDRGLGKGAGAGHGQGPSLRTIAEALEEEKYNDSFDEDGKDNDERKEEGKDGGGSKATVGGDRCAVGTWTNAQRREGARFLNELTAEAQQEDVLRAMMNDGSPPAAPRLWDGSHAPPEAILGASQGGSHVGHTASCTELRVCWAPAKTGDLVSFFSVEFGGAAGVAQRGGTSLSDRYKEIFRDPEDASPGKSFVGNLLKGSLQPGTSYLFRIRAFNGFGHGEYTYKILTTTPSQPPCPRITSISSDSVTLRWTFSLTFLKRMEELKRVFKQADLDGSGQIGREEFAAALDVKRPGGGDLLEFISKVAAKVGLNVPRDGLGPVFDAIESDDDGQLSWKEFENFFMNAGWSSGNNNGEGSMVGMAGGNDPPDLADLDITQEGDFHNHHNTTSNSRGPMSSSGNVLRGSKEGSLVGSVRSKTGGGGGSVAGSVLSSAQALARVSTDITYVVERCEDEFRDVYKKETSTTLGQATIHRLEPGMSYRFRVYALNTDGVEGPRSESIIVHTLVETPAVPNVVLKSLNAVYPHPEGLPPEESASMFLTWKPRSAGMSSKAPRHVQKMLGNWAGSHEEQQGGVDIQQIFAKYDVDRSGTMDMQEFESVLNDLAVVATRERIEALFRDFDADGNGVLSFTEFCAWWNDDRVSSTIKRSDPVPTLMSRRSASSQASQPLIDRVVEALNNTSLVSFTGQGLGAGDLAGVAAGISNSRPPPARSQSASRSRTGPAGGSQSLALHGKKNAPSSSQVHASAPSNRPQVATPHAYPLGDKSKAEMTGLRPNTLYHFKLRYCGPRSNSLLSDPLAVMTAPLPPSQPQVVIVTAVTARIKFYPPICGAFKFLVQLLPTNNAAKNGLKSQDIFKGEAAMSGSGVEDFLGGKIGANGDLHGPAGEWVSVYYGPETLYLTTTLVADSDYQCRIFAVNCQGICSDPSPVQSFSTLRRAEASAGGPGPSQSQISVVGGLGAISPRTAEYCFTIECTGDICVGDTVLLTERMFYKERSTIATTAPSSNTNPNGQGNNNGIAGVGEKGANGVKSVVGGKTVAGSKARDNAVNVSAEGLGLGGGRSMLTATVRMDLSVTSMQGGSVRRRDEAYGDGPAPGTFMGERTIAAYVIKDNYRSVRDEVRRAGVSPHPRDAGRFGKYRKLWLEVIWSKCSNEACKRYELKPGVVVERMQGQLEQFEVFRAPWPAENKRKRLGEEWESLADCYQQADC